jgi:hypothetical protein
MKKKPTRLSLNKTTVSNLKKLDYANRVKGGITARCISEMDPDCTATQDGCTPGTYQSQCYCSGSWCYTCNPYEYTCQELCTSFHNQTC